jgi:hypothetical protein
MDEIVATLCKNTRPVLFSQKQKGVARFGYDLRWMILGAHHMGAPHRRRRWFCVAVHNGERGRNAMCKLNRAFEQQQWDVYPPWSTTPPPVMTLLNDRTRRIRCAALGNAVVPDCVREALRQLSAPQLESLTAWSTKKWPRCGRCVRSRARRVMVSKWTPRLVDRAPVLGLRFNPNAYRSPKPPSVLHKASRLQAPYPSRRWTTPRHGNVSGANVLTRRTVFDLR